MSGDDLDIELVQVLDEEGNVLDPAAMPDLDDDALRDMYRLMKQTRVFDEKAVTKQRQGAIGTYPPCAGQEAAQVGSAFALDPERDMIFPSYREQGTLFKHGLSMEKYIRYWTGDEAGNDIPDDINIFPASVPVGSHPPHAAGWSYADRYLGEDGVTVAYFGDGATSEGDVHEGMNFAGAWDVPTIFFCNNNQYAISVPLEKQTRADTLAQKAVAYGFDGIQVDGMDPLAVYAATTHAVENALTGDESRPMFIEAVQYRFGAHTTADDPSVYRDEDEVEQWKQKDPLTRMEAFLRNEGVLDDDSITAIDDEIEAAVNDAFDTAITAAHEDPAPADMFEHVYAEKTRRLHEQESWFTDQDDWDVTRTTATPDGDTEELNLVEAVQDALHTEMIDDDDVLVLGEDVGTNGGVFRATDGLYEEFGEDRVIDTPLAESGIVGTSIGMAAHGLKPVAEIQFMGFIYPAFDQIVSHAARLRTRSRGSYTCPLVVRAPYGGGIKAPEHHSESTEAFFSHHPGLKVAMPSNPYDAKGLLASAVQDPDPVVFLEPKQQYRSFREEVPVDRYKVPLGEANVVREGDDVSVYTWGAMTQPTLAAADGLDDIDVEVVDLRTVSPLDIETITESFTKTGRAAVVHEAPLTVGLGAEIAATIQEEALLYQEAPVKRIAGFDAPFPLYQLEDDYLPDQREEAYASELDRITAGIRDAAAF